MENLYKLLFSLVGALFFILAMGSYIKTEQSMKQFQQEAIKASHKEVDDWVIANSSLESKLDEVEPLSEVSGGGITLSEVTKEYIVDFLAGYQEENREDNVIQVLFQGKSYGSSEFEGLISEIKENDRYCMKVNRGFQYEIIASSKE